MSTQSTWRLDSFPGDVNKPWRHYQFHQRATAWVSQHLFDRVVYKTRHGLLKGLKRKGGLGWVPDWLCRGLYTPEIRFLERTDLQHQVVYDIGAFHGLLTLFFARRAQHVVAYEPVQRNRARLLDNIALNGLRNVTVRDLALGATALDGEIWAEALMSGYSKLELSTVSATDNAVREKVSITTLDEDIREHRLPAPTFLKVDVEGYELQVLHGAKSTLNSARPDLFLEMHGQTVREKLQTAEQVVTFLFDMGYRDVKHVESGLRIMPANSFAAARGHLYCRREIR